MNAVAVAHPPRRLRFRHRPDGPAADHDLPGVGPDALRAVATAVCLPTATGTRRARVLAGMTAVEAHEAHLFARLLAGLDSIGGVTLHGHADRRAPTALLTVDGAAPQEVSRALAARGVNAPTGHFYALELSRRAGLGDTGGVRAGLSAYSDEGDVDRLLAGVAAAQQEA